MTCRRIVLMIAAAALAIAASMAFLSPAQAQVSQTDVAPSVAGTDIGSIPISGPIPCLDGSTVEFGQLCPLPQIPCLGGSSVPIGSFCPPPTFGTAQCADGSTVPNGQICKPVTCSNGSTVPDGQTCKPVTCSNGSTVPDGQTCPPKQCPGGSTVPNGGTCPQAKAYRKRWALLRARRPGTTGHRAGPR